MRRALLALFLLGCGQSRSLHPTVVVDEAFTTAERQEVASALSAWETSVPELHFSRSSVSHASIVAEEHFPANDTIYIVRVTEFIQPDCPEREPIANPKGVVLGLTSGSSLCIDVITTERFSTVRQVVMHEVGHALGLGHRPPPSVMTPAVNNAEEFPTAGDVAALRALYP